MKTIMAIAIGLTGLIALTGSALAQDVEYFLTDSGGVERTAGDLTFQSTPELKFKDRLNGSFNDANERVKINRPGGERTFNNACEALMGVLKGRLRDSGGQEYINGVKLAPGDRFKIVISGVLERVCEGTARLAQPDNAASPVAIDIHGGYECHDTNGLEEQYGVNHETTGARCP